MTLEVISFALGGILILTAIVGGGFEVREIRIPRVGSGARAGALVVGSAFTLLGLVLWSVERFPAEGGDTPPLVWTDSAEEPLPPVAPPDVVRTYAPPQTYAFTGFVGTSYLNWDVHGVRYDAVWQTNGATGWVRVGFPDPYTGVRTEVVQDLALMEADGQHFYQGMNPRYASNGLAMVDYAPDAFRVVPAGHGQWTIDVICDGNVCAAVTVLPQ